MSQKALGPDARRRREPNFQGQVTEPNRPDAEELAAGVRALAVDAHDALNDPLVTAATLNHLSRRIEELRRAARSAHLSEIDRWLQQAQRRVEERWPAARPTTRA
jgi:hypothetical protein